MILVDSLAISYGAQQAVGPVSLEIPRGEITAVVGPSGCGKSSFLWALNRMTDLIPSAQVRGRVVVDGVDIYANGHPPRDLRLRVGMIFQKANPFPLSVRRNIELALREHGERNRGRLGEITERVLRQVGLWGEVAHRLDGPALELSGGQQQRLCMARALALEPEVLLLDEPCSALDPISSAVVEELIASLRGRYTLVVVTHNLAQARRLADQVAVFWLIDGSGMIIEQGPAETVFSSPENVTAAAYLRGAKG